MNMVESAIAVGTNQNEIATHFGALLGHDIHEVHLRGLGICAATSLEQHSDAFWRRLGGSSIRTRDEDG